MNHIKIAYIWPIAQSFLSFGNVDTTFFQETLYELRQLCNRDRNSPWDTWGHGPCSSLHPREWHKRCEGGRFKEPHEVRLGRRVVVLHDCVDDTHLPGGDSSNASVLLWVLPIQTTTKEEWKEMEVGTCTDDRTAQQAGCTGVATRSIGWKGTYWDLIAKTHMRCITYILLHYIWKINVNIQDVYHRALLPFQSDTLKKKNYIEIHSFSKIIFLTIFFHSKNIKRISINE